MSSILSYSSNPPTTSSTSHSLLEETINAFEEAKRQLFPLDRAKALVQLITPLIQNGDIARVFEAYDCIATLPHLGVVSK